MRVWVARPEPGASRTAAALGARGHTPLLAPVLVIRPTGAALPAGPVDAVLLTSANAVPGPQEAAALRGLPVFAVGARTAGLAAAAGLGPVREGPGDAAGLAALAAGLLAPGARLLHRAGAERKAEPAATLTAAGFRVATVVAYAAEALPSLPDAVDRALDAGALDAVVHYSRRSAAVALDLAEAAGHGGAFRALRHYCLSEDVAAPLEAAGVPVHFVAARPREADLLDALTPGRTEPCGDREDGSPYLALAPEAAAVLGGRGDAVQLEDLPVTPPPSDADKPGPGGRKPDPAAAKPGPTNPPGTENRSAASAPAKPASAGGPPPRPATEPVVAAKPGTTDTKPDAAKPETGKPDTGKPGPGAIIADAPKPAGGTVTSASAAKPENTRAEPGKAEPGKVDSGKTEPPKAGGPAAGAAAAEAAKGETRAETKTDAPKAGQPGSGPQPGGRPGGPASGAAGAAAASAVTAGPILDLKAKRIPDPTPSATPTGKEPPKDGVKEAAKEPPKGPIPAAAAKATVPPVTPASARGRAGFGSLAAAGLLGGVIGAGLLFGAEKAGIGPDPRLNALDQRLSGQLAALDKRLDGLAPRDALAALDKRVASAESTAKQALDKASSAPAPAASAEGQSSGQSSGQAPAVPADLVARLDSLDQRVAALQEEPGQEPGRDQPADAKLNAVQDTGKQVADLDARLKALEANGANKAAEDMSKQVAALQSEVAQKTKANADADAALGQRLDALQQSLDSRVKAATEAVQAATQASRTAAEAGQAQAAEAVKAVDRRLQEQADKIAALDKSVAQRAEAGTVQAALRVVVADRVTAALEAGTPYAEPLATLRKLDPATDAQAKALAPFATSGAPTAGQLADDFRPIAERIAAKSRAQRAKSASETGDFRSKLLSMADGLVQVRKVDTPAPEAADDPESKVQAALDRGDLSAAAASFAALPPAAQDEAGDFGAKLKARAAAEEAARSLLDTAFKALPTGTASDAAAPAAAPAR